MTHSLRLARAAAFLCAAIACSGVMAQAYPNRALRRGAAPGR
ncbi:MAG: hypothetical protein ACRD3C_22330 [Vicinamibacterales bacterium]